MFYRNLRDLSGQMLIFLACGAVYKGKYHFCLERCRRDFFEISPPTQDIYIDFRAPQARFFLQFHHLSKVFIFISSAAGEIFFGNFHHLYKGFTLIFERRRRENFGILDRLHKGFTPILERRRRDFFWNLQEHFENCRTFKQPFWHRRTFQLLNFENRRKPWIVEHIQHSFWES